MSAEQVWDSIVALGKDNPDEPSAATRLETQQLRGTRTGITRTTTLVMLRHRIRLH